MRPCRQHLFLNKLLYFFRCKITINLWPKRYGIRGAIFTFRGLFISLPKFPTHECSMNDNLPENIIFVESIEGYDFAKYTADHIMHILCTRGSMSFVFHNVHYNIVEGDYIILGNLSFASQFSHSSDCECIIMSFAESFIISMALRSNYGFIGRFALMRNPVMKLSECDFEKCRTDLLRLKNRLAEKEHIFHEEMLGHLLSAHVLDLYDIHARMRGTKQVPERAGVLMQRFVELLYRGEYIAHRQLEHYASILCITPHYLSEICKEISGEPASFWIDRFTIYEVVRLLGKKELSLAEVAERLNFSSLSYFSRYVQKRIGVSPSVYRNNFLSEK